MPGGIFLVHDDGELLELAEQPYESEDLLQGLIERYPNVLAGDQLDHDAPRRWILVKREVAVPAERDGLARWSIDHLFVDQDGIPTIVEVKRSSDTRIRREVVGQMLDYAANAVVHWPVEFLRSSFEQRCRESGIDPEETLRAAFGPTLDAEPFWQAAKTNLQAGRIRLVFVADAIPPELRRIVEFLNQQMDPAEVIAIEIRQYVGRGVRSLIPRVLGQTEQARQRKGSGRTPGRRWDEAAFFAVLEERRGAEEARVAREIHRWAVARHARIDFGSGRNDGSLFVCFDRDTEVYYPIALWTYGRVEVQFQWLRMTRVFSDERAREELRQRLNAIEGVSIPEGSLERRPSFPLSALASTHALQRLQNTLEWFVRHVDGALESDLGRSGDGRPPNVEAT